MEVNPKIKGLSDTLAADKKAYEKRTAAELKPIHPIPESLQDKPKQINTYVADSVDNSEFIKSLAKGHGPVITDDNIPAGKPIGS